MDTIHNWYTTFFNGLALELWDQAIPAAYTALEIRFIEALLPPDQKARILDIPCGSGRHSVLLAEKGHKITGIDISEENVEKLKAIKIQKNLPISLIRADMLECNIQGRFDMAICMGNSFGFFGYEQTNRFIRIVAERLIKNGIFIINTGILAESILMNFEQHKWYETGGIFFLIENSYLPGESVLRSDLIFIKAGEIIERKTVYQYVYTLAAVYKMLAGNGFSRISVYSEPGEKDYKLGDQQAYIVARK